MMTKKLRNQILIGIAVVTALILIYAWSTNDFANPFDNAAKVEQERK